MAARFVTIDYDTPLILPPNLREWVPVNHLAHFILDVVEEIDLRQVRVNERGTGSEQYPPRMLLALLLYCYATGLFSPDGGTNGRRSIHRNDRLCGGGKEGASSHG